MMTKKKKRLLALALVIWVLGSVYLASKTFDYYREGKQAGADDSLTLERIMFPSRQMRDQE
jgi:hypothetical protein